MSEARERVLDTAEELFHSQGYKAVTMRDIAQALGMKQASLYYHVPQGKEQLYAEIVTRSLRRHEAGLQAAIGSGVSLEEQLHTAVRWVFSQPPMNLIKMMESDMPALSENVRQELDMLAFQALFLPLGHMFRQAITSGEIRPELDPNRLTGTFLALLEGIQFAANQRQTDMSTLAMADEVIDILLNGLKPRP
jgi:TetR/AcrR family transcriptional regulator, cholesterol catabolism regulator